MGIIFSVKVICCGSYTLLHVSCPGLEASLKSLCERTIKVTLPSYPYT